MKNYLDLMGKVLRHGEVRADRTGTGTLGLFGERLDFNLCSGFPAVTTKRLFFKGVVTELCWMLSGREDVKPMTDVGVHIWDEWANENGSVGPCYGPQWRCWFGGPKGRVDQIHDVVKALREDPWSRRHLVSAWNVADLSSMSLPPCHLVFQFHVSADRGLSCLVYMRSVDVFLGLPFDIASYAVLTHLVARSVGMYPRMLTFMLGDTHLYRNHLDQAREQLSRDPLPPPELALRDPPEGRPYWSAVNVDNMVMWVDDVGPDDITLEDYRCHPAIKAKVSI